MVEPWVVHGTATVVEPWYDGRFYRGFYIGKIYNGDYSKEARFDQVSTVVQHGRT